MSTKRPPRPTPAPVQFDNIPKTLQERAQWAVWRYKWSATKSKWDKPPYQVRNPRAHAASDDSSTWATFEATKERYLEGGWDGIYFCLSKEDPFTGLDYDGAYNPETQKIEGDAAGMVAGLDTYTEISPSGKGIRQFARGKLGDLKGRKKGNIEIYDNERFLSVTGNLYGPPKGVEERQKEIEALHRQVWPEKPKTNWSGKPQPTNADDETVLELARANVTGAHFDRLWKGDLSDHIRENGEPDHSGGDLALCNFLRFETGDPKRVDELFRKSGLYREKKWNEVHYSDGTTYGEHTVELAMDGEVRKSKSEKYKPQIYSDDTLKRTQASRATLPARMNAAELMRLELAAARHIVPGYVPVGLALLAARPKIGKSWLALALSIATAKGGKVLGQNVEQGDALYLALEDNWRRLQDRLGQLLGADEEPLERLDFWMQCPRLHDGGLNEILTWIDEHPDARLVVIDTWAKVEPPNTGRGADYAHITSALGPLQQMALERDIAVVIVHHTKKPSKEGGDVFDQVLGTTAFVGIADTIMVMQRERMEADAVLAVTGRDIDERQVAMTFDEETGLWSVVGNAETMRIPATQRLVLEAIDEGYTTPKELAGHLGKGRTSVQNTLSRLVDKGLITTGVGGNYKLTTPLQGRSTGMIKIGDTRDSNDTGDRRDTRDTPPVEAQVPDEGTQVSPSVTKVSPPVDANSDTPEEPSRSGKSASKATQVSPVSPVSPPPRKSEHIPPDLKPLLDRLEAATLPTEPIKIKGGKVADPRLTVASYMRDLASAGSRQRDAALDHLREIMTALEATS